MVLTSLNFKRTARSIAGTAKSCQFSDESLLECLVWSRGSWNSDECNDVESIRSTGHAREIRPVTPVYHRSTCPKRPLSAGIGQFLPEGTGRAEGHARWRIRKMPAAFGVVAPGLRLRGGLGRSWSSRARSMCPARARPRRRSAAPSLSTDQRGGGLGGPCPGRRSECDPLRHLGRRGAHRLREEGTAQDVVKLVAGDLSEDPGRWGKPASDVQSRRLVLLLPREVLLELREPNEAGDPAE